MARPLGKNIRSKKSIYGFRRRQRENMLIALQPVLDTKRTCAPLQHFVARQPVDGGANHRSDTAGQAAPPLAIMNTQVPLVAAKQFVRPLADEGNFHILAR